MAGRYGTTKADWWNDFSNNMANSTQDAMRMLMQKTLQQKMNEQEMGLKSKLLKDQSQQELVSAIKKAAAEGMFSGTLASDDIGSDINSLISGDYNFGNLRPVTMEDKINRLKGLGAIGKPQTMQEMANEQGRINDGFGAPQGGRVIGPALGDKSPMQVGGAVMDDYITNPNYLLTGKGDPLMLSPDVERERKINDQIVKEVIQGPSGEVGGRVALAKESIKNIDDIIKILFPDGTPKSFKRTTAFASNLPGGSLPMLPQRAWGQAEQDVFRKMGAALSGRQLIQTGVAARPEETAKLVAQFAPSAGSNPDSALNGLLELKKFYEDYISQTDPEARFGKIGMFTGGSKRIDMKSKYGLE